MLHSHVQRSRLRSDVLLTCVFTSKLLFRLMNPGQPELLKASTARTVLDPLLNSPCYFRLKSIPPPNGPLLSVVHVSLLPPVPQAFRFCRVTTHTCLFLPRPLVSDHQKGFDPVLKSLCQPKARHLLQSPSRLPPAR